MVYNQKPIEAQSSLSWLKATLAGLVSTVPMSVFMLATQRLLPKGYRYALPPEVIMKELADRAHISHHMSKKQVVIATTISHFGYGATMGLLYSPLGKKVPLPGAVKGILFGLFVWTASYLVLLPLGDMDASGQKEPVRRNLMMIGAHVVWGSAMGVITDILIRRLK